jgi:signal transduction histidine kinase
VDTGIAVLYALLFLVYPVALDLLRRRFYLPVAVGGGVPGGAPDWTLTVASWASAVLILVCAIAIAGRRLWPRASFVVICAAGAIQFLLDEPISFWNLAMLLSLFSAAAYTTRGFGLLALAVALAAGVGLWVRESGVLEVLPGLVGDLRWWASDRGASFVAVIGLLVLIWSLGDQVRASRERLELTRERAVQRERAANADARMAALAERQRIARELHDVVAHGLSVVIVQADGARYAAATHPEAPLEALATIAATGRESLAEMRRLLGVLRDEGPTAMAPQPGVEAIPELVDGFREAGLDIRMSVDGVVRPVSPAVGLAAYRVVQESLTNVLKHAGHASVQVLLAFLPGGVGVSVDNGPGDRIPPTVEGMSGLGLMGMRERVGLLGGRISATRTPSGGFQVRADIPDDPSLGIA